MQLSLLILWCNPSASPERTKASIASATLAFVNALVFLVLSYLEHSKSLRPSAIVNAYLFFSVIFDAVRLRTLWLIDFDTKIAALFASSLALKVLILILEATEKRRYISGGDPASYSPEETSGVLGQGIFAWLNQLIVNGARKILSVGDLYPLHHEMETEGLYSTFQKNWEICMSFSFPVIILLVRFR